MDQSHRRAREGGNSSVLLAEISIESKRTSEMTPNPAFGRKANRAAWRQSLYPRRRVSSANSPLIPDPFTAMGDSARNPINVADCWSGACIGFNGCSCCLQRQP